MPGTLAEFAVSVLLPQMGGRRRDVPLMCVLGQTNGLL